MRRLRAGIHSRIMEEFELEGPSKGLPVHLIFPLVKVFQCYPFCPAVPCSPHSDPGDSQNTFGCGICPIPAWQVPVWSQQQHPDQHKPFLALSGLIQASFSACFALKHLFPQAALMGRDELGKTFPAPRTQRSWEHWSSSLAREGQGL